MKNFGSYIVQENDNWIAINKPSGLLTIPDREQKENSLKEILQKRYGQIFVVHRIDKDTSGLVIFAKNESTHRFLSMLFEGRKIIKTYLGLVMGNPDPAFGEIHSPIAEHPTQKGLMTVHRSGKPSHTTFSVVEAHANYSLVSFKLHTGRTHQIRVHAKEIGHPLACDPLYGDGKPVYLSAIKKKFNLSKTDESERPMVSRLALHSWKLSFADADEQEVELIAEMPKEFRALMNQLRKIS